MQQIICFNEVVAKERPPQTNLTWRQNIRAAFAKLVANKVSSKDQWALANGAVLLLLNLDDRTLDKLIHAVRGAKDGAPLQELIDLANQKRLMDVLQRQPGYSELSATRLEESGATPAKPPHTPSNTPAVHPHRAGRGPAK